MKKIDDGKIPYKHMFPDFYKLLEILPLFYF